MRRIIAGISLWLAGWITAAWSEEESANLDRIWGWLTWYDNEEALTLQKFSWVGRLQADAAGFDADQGEYEKLTWRRFRFGGKASVLGRGALHLEADLDLNDTGDLYNRLTDAYAGWSGERVAIKAGKQSAGFTLDGATSSKKLITLERSVVADNLWFSTEYFTGLSATWEQAAWTLKVGGYSCSGDPEFGSFDSGFFGLVSVGCDAGDRFGFDSASVRLDYVYNDPDDKGEVGVQDLEQVASLVAQMERGALGLWTDLSVASGRRDQSDLWGLQVMPFWDLSESWQVVFRYAMVSGEDGSGVELSRYPGKIESGLAEEAHDLFLGVNWYLYGHRLKWQNGIEYNLASNLEDNADDYEGWGITSGLRISW